MASQTFQDTVAFSGLTNPTSVQFARDGRVFVAEKSGLIKVFPSLTVNTPTVFADLRTNVHNYWDRGLLGLALDPNFPATPNVYVLYTYDAAIGGTAPRWGLPNTDSDGCPTPPGPTTNGCAVSGRLSRLQASGSVMTGAEQVLLEDWFQQFPSHSIGTVAFGPEGALYVSGGDGASFNYVDYGQTGNPGGDPPGGTLTPPTAEGGALRAQDFRTTGDTLGYDGAILRLDPATGAAMADNPLIGSSDPKARRMIAYGFRNPFRFTFRPGTRELWIGDVGWSTWEEIDRILDARTAILDFGWPCYEGVDRQPGYDAANLSLCENLYAAGTSAVVAPYYQYNHAAQVTPTDTGAINGSSITGVAFYNGGSYPSQYVGALFFADYSRNKVWVMLPGANGLPNAAAPVTFLPNAASPVYLTTGPGGDLFYADLTGGTIRRVVFNSANHAPVANAGPDQAVASGQPVTLDGSASSDPDGQALNWKWTQTAGPAVALSSTTAARPTFTAPTGPASLVFSLTVSDAVATSTPDTVTVAVSGAAGLTEVTHTGTIVARVTSPTGGGNHDPEVIRDGDMPPVGTQDSSRQWDSWDGANTAPEDWIGYVYPAPLTFTRVVFQEGRHFVDGGWFDSLTVQVRQNGTWVAVPGLSITPAYPGNNGITFETFTLDFAPITGDGIRIDGAPGGSADFISVGELRVFTGSTVANLPPGADAGPDQTVPPSSAVTLDGSRSSDPEGASLTYRWTQRSGPTVTLSSTTAVRPTFTAPAVATTLVFDLVVSDGTLQSVADSVVVTVAGAGVDLTHLGTIVARVMNPTGGGNHDLEVIRDGDLPPPGTQDSSRQYDSFDGFNAATEDWIGYVYTSPQTFGRVVFEEGRDFVDGGWFLTLTVQVRANGVWSNVPGVTITPAYPGADDGESFDTYTLDFPAVTGDGIRIYGVPGGSSQFVSVGELQVFGSSAQGTNTPPVPRIATPASTLTWQVGDTIAFSGSGSDTEDGTLAASRLSWSVILHHCTTPTTCHTHPVQDFAGVASGSFVAPDHAWPSYLEVKLTATDSGGLAAATSVAIQPRAVDLTFTSNPSGVPIVLDGTAAAAPFTSTVIVGSAHSISAPTPVTLGGTSYGFTAWSDGGAASHNVVAGSTATTYFASYVILPTAPTNLTASAVSSSRIDLGWTDTSGIETGFKIERQPAGGSFAQIATVGVNATTFSDTTAAAGTTYTYRVRAMDAGGDSPYSNTATATTPAGPVPAPWVTADVGNVGLTGSATYANGTFTVKGAGADIGGTADGFRFVYQPLSGTGSITARVTSVQNTNGSAKAGVMMRETTAAGSRYAMMLVTPTNGLLFERRTSTNGPTSSTAGPHATAPYWVRVTRSGSTFRGYVSTNGTSWTQVAAVSIPMATRIDVGLAVTSRTRTALNTSTFDNVN